MEDFIINKANPDIYSIGGLECRPSIRKSEQNINSNVKTKKLAFNEIAQIYKSKLSFKSQTSFVSCKNSTEYLETEQRSLSATSKYDNDISFSIEVDMKKDKKSVLQNLIYLYNEQNKIKIYTDKKYSRNSTPISLLKDGMKNSFIKFNDKEIAKFQSIDLHSEQQKYNLIEKSVLHILDYINDHMCRKYKRNTFLDFLNIQIKSSYNSILNMISMNCRGARLFELNKPNFKLNQFTNYYINKNYFDNYEDYVFRVNTVFQNDFEGLNMSNRDFYLLNLSHQNKMIQTFSPPFSPKKTKLKLSSQMVVKTNRIMLFGIDNNMFCSKYLKNDQDELHRSLNTTRKFIDCSDHEDEYRRVRSKLSTKFTLKSRKNSVEVSTNAITSPSQVFSKLRKFTSPSKHNSKINLTKKSIKNIIKINKPVNSGFNSTNASSLNIKHVDTSNTRESFLLSNPNFFKKHETKKEKNEIDINTLMILKELKRKKTLQRKVSFLSSPLTLLKKNGGTEEEAEKKQKNKNKYKGINREAFIFNTHQITADIIKKFTEPNELIAFFIKNNNYHKFIENINKLNYNIDYKDKDGNSFLILAVLSNNLQITEYLLDLGCDPNIQNNKLNTPLHYALINKNFQLGDLLIKANSDQTLTNSQGLTPWQYIC